MKKIISILSICLLLTGCQSTNPQSEETKGKQEASISAQALRYQNLFDGAGNENGYYHINYRNLGDDSIYNLYYYDYATKKEIFLCDKPECKHMDASCTSYLENGVFGESLILNGDHLYLITNEIASFGTDNTTSSGPMITQMDLDGKNKKVLCTLPDNYSFDSTAVAMDEQYLYLPISKSQTVEINSGNSLQTITDTRLYAVNLANGDSKDLMDFKDQQIIGTKKRSLILAKYTYSEDPEKLLKEKNYARYDEVMMNARCVYTSYDIDQKSYGEKVHTDSATVCYYDDDTLYYEENCQIHAVNMKDGKDEVIAELKNHLNFAINRIIDGYLLIDGWSKQEEAYQMTYALDQKTYTLKELTLKTKEPINAVTIYGETKDAFFVYYDHDQHLEKTWAGTNQYEMDKMYYGLISKNDFWNSKANYETFTNAY